MHALVGENGAGKSTLIKILSGVYDFQQGTYLLEGKAAGIAHPADAIRQGIIVVYQELELVPGLSVAENIFFGRLPHTRSGRVLWPQLHAQTEVLLDQVGLDVDTGTKVGYLGIAAQQLVEIARALSCRARVIVLDEPTSALSLREIDRLFSLVAKLRDEGVGLVYVSHKLKEILRLGDRVTVLRDGQVVGTEPTSAMDEDRLIAMMVGRKLAPGIARTLTAKEDIILEVEALSTRGVEEVSFQVKRGEIVGFSGLMGAGRTELARAVLGVDRRLSGRVLLDGEPVPADSPPAARRMGMGLVPEDRRTEGLFPRMSVAENMTIAALEQSSRRGHIRQGRERERVVEMVDALAIQTPSVDQIIAKLSGGNQQKVLIARWLLKRI